MTAKRHYSFLDKICLSIDQAVRALTDNAKTSGQAYPANDIDELVMKDKQRKHAAGLMRVNHTGEICAQALYHGQWLGTRNTRLQEAMQDAAIEEGDHLAWCKQRLNELDSHTSYLNPLFYAGSFCIGLAAGMIGDEWSLGFVAETERQVIKHLSGHLQKLPAEDLRSHAILKRMESDEAKHRDQAVATGAADLPDFIKWGMRYTSKVMVATTYWI